MQVRSSHNRLTSAQRARDEALARTGRARRWVIAGSGALTVGIAALVSALAPGRTLAARTKSHTAPSASSGRRAATTGGLTMPPLATPSQLGLQPPGSPPQAAPSTTPEPPAGTSQTQSAPPAAPSGGAVSGGS